MLNLFVLFLFHNTNHCVNLTLVQHKLSNKYPPHSCTVVHTDRLSPWNLKIFGNNNSRLIQIRSAIKIEIRPIIADNLVKPVQLNNKHQYKHDYYT